MNESRAIVVLANTGSKEEAVHTATTLVHERLAACANLVRNVRSIYRWEDK